MIISQRPTVFGNSWLLSESATLQIFTSLFHQPIKFANHHAFIFLRIGSHCLTTRTENAGLYVLLSSSLIVSIQNSPIWFIGCYDVVSIQDSGYYHEVFFSCNFCYGT